MLYPREDQGIPQQIQPKSWSYIAIGSSSSPHSLVSGGEQKSNSSSEALKGLICVPLSKGATSLSAEQEYGEGTERATFHCKSSMLEASAHNNLSRNKAGTSLHLCLQKTKRSHIIFYAKNFTENRG